MGLLLAALVIGASLMMYVDTSLTMWGYPAIAMTFFLLAAVGAFSLIVRILFKDRMQQATIAALLELNAIQLGHVGVWSWR